jgi:hypothetical protein
MIAAEPARPRLLASCRRVGVRILAAVLLTAITCVPSMARAHDRVDHQRTPAQQHSRFRWTNSCESVPQKVTTVVVVVPSTEPVQTAIDRPSHAWRRLPSDEPSHLLSSRRLCPQGLRAPPASS